MTFKLCNLGSKNPYFNRAYIVSSGFGGPHLQILIFFEFLQIPNGNSATIAASSSVIAGTTRFCGRFFHYTTAQASATTVCSKYLEFKDTNKLVRFQLPAKGRGSSRNRSFLSTFCCHPFCRAFAISGCSALLSIVQY